MKVSKYEGLGLGGKCWMRHVYKKDCIRAVCRPVGKCTVRRRKGLRVAVF